jgi:hypothetical protein
LGAKRRVAHRILNMDNTWAFLLLFAALGIVRGLFGWIDPKLKKEDEWDKWSKL